MATNMLNINNLRLAVLIDAENVPRNCIKSVLEEIAVYGTPTIKRIYGDWTNPTVAGWKLSLLENAITPIQQYSYTIGKNSSDSAMIIDAMDILYTDKTDGFVIVSSDSDFTRLAIRLREAGQWVIGIGERKTPSAFIAACNKFTYVEVIRANARGHIAPVDETTAEYEGPKATAADTSSSTTPTSPATSATNTATAAPAPAKKPSSRGKKARKDGAAADAESIESVDSFSDTNSYSDLNANGKSVAGEDSGDKQSEKSSAQAKPRSAKVPPDVITLIADSVADLADDTGVVFMGELGNLILKKQPDFDHRNFGFKSLSAMIKSIDRFVTDFRQTTDPNIKHVYVRDREAI